MPDHVIDLSGASLEDLKRELELRRLGPPSPDRKVELNNIHTRIYWAHIIDKRLVQIHADLLEDLAVQKFQES